MKTLDASSFDVETLRQLAGAKVFGRGEDYWRGGRVRILAREPSSVQAEVAGTENYRTTLRGGGTRIDGDCTCRAFEDYGFCKHLVATALAANTPDAGAQPDVFAHIREHLGRQGIDVLVAMIMQLAEQDEALFRRLELMSISIDRDDKAIEKRLRKALDAATRTPRYVEYRQARAWATGVELVLDAIAGLVPAGHAKIALPLAEYALEKVAAAARSIDDSDGHCGGLLERAVDIHLSAAGAARPEPVALARFLYGREIDDDYGLFTDAAARYAETLGEEGLDEYRRLALQAWAALPPRTATRGSPGFSYEHHRLSDILDFFARREGDIAARVALRTKDLSSPRQYQKLAEFCLANGREDEALRFAEEGLWTFEDKPDERLVLFAVGLHQARGRKADAASLLWATFEKLPSLQLFERLRDLVGSSAVERAIELLTSRLDKAKRAAWESPAELLVRILVQEQKFDAAWSIVANHGASTGTLELLVHASEQTHPREARAVYAKRIFQLAEAGNGQAYQEAASLVARVGRLQSAAEQAAFVADLKTRFGRRRNLMKLLE